MHEKRIVDLVVLFLTPENSPHLSVVNSLPARISSASPHLLTSSPAAVVATVIARPLVVAVTAAPVALRRLPLPGYVAPATMVPAKDRYGPSKSYGGCSIWSLRFHGSISTCVACVIWRLWLQLVVVVTMVTTSSGCGHRDSNICETRFQHLASVAAAHRQASRHGSNVWKTAFQHFVNTVPASLSLGGCVAAPPVHGCSSPIQVAACHAGGHVSPCHSFAARPLVHCRRNGRQL